MDAQSLINWTVVGQQIDNASELRYDPILSVRRSITVVYRRHRQALSTVRFCRAGQLATADIWPRYRPVGSKIGLFFFFFLVGSA